MTLVSKSTLIMILWHITTECRQFLKRWEEQAKRRGVKLGKLITRGVHAVRDARDLREVARDLVERDNCDFMLVFVPSKTDESKGW